MSDLVCLRDSERERKLNALSLSPTYIAIVLVHQIKMASTSSAQPQPVDLRDLDVPTLAEVRRQLEEELIHLSNSFAQLRQAQVRFRGCIDHAGQVKPENKDKTILVPLTTSLYVPGKLSDLEHVIVDVGTGYYVKKTRPQALKYYEAKVEYIRGNLEALQETIQKKQEFMKELIAVLQMKLQQQASGKDSKAG
ncbi:Prefoldin-domain-containing protein [Daedaleopsis nitida]|nr:Prefoldin-domain-containing protein [Daedaleopsis nitida]